MRLKRLPAILANATALLLLGFAGVALASEITVDGVQLFGPVFFSGDYPFALASPSPGSLLFGDSFLSGLLYFLPNVSSLLTPLETVSAVSTLFADNIGPIVLLPATDSLFSAIPEPATLSLVVTGVAAVGFLYRRTRLRRAKQG